MVEQLTYRNATVALIVALLVLVAGAFLYGKIAGSSDMEARTTVEEFGLEMQKVSLLSPEASSTIATTYGSYATSELIADWQKDPESAPGRLTSSPYPARINILSTAKQGTGYIVNGEVILATTEGDAGKVPVILLVVPVEEDWRIAAYQEQRAATSTR